MKKFLVAAALVGTSVGAQAADLPAKAKYYKAPMAAVYNWTGFYIGVNAGVGIGSSFTQLSHTAVGGDASSYLGGLGGVGGGQIGYNWQYGDVLGFGNLVLGLEADIQGAGLRDKRTCEFLCSAVISSTVGQNLDWFGTVRGRVGIATGPVLSYFTGGFAYGGVKTTITDNIALQTNTFSNTRTGYTLGSGVEAALGGNWTGKIEYLYVNLGTQTGANALAATPFVFRSDITEHIFRVGLNYRINGNGAYSEPVANWAGLYLGGNVAGASALNRSSLTGTAVPGIGAVNEKFNQRPNGYNGGLQIGYNWQFANWVLGLEADAQGAAQKEGSTCELGCAPAAPQLAAFTQKLDWFGTVRGRVGYSVGRTLFYATGGLAYGDVKTTILGATNGVTPINLSYSNTKTGYAVGGGVESPFNAFGWFGPNWTSKTEYLFVDLGRSTNADAATGLTYSTKVQEHLFRTGLNYHFNSPVVAKY